MNRKRVLAVMMVLLAFLAGYGVAQAPRGVITEQARAATAIWAPLEVSSPRDRIAEEHIQVFPEEVVLGIKNAQWSRFTDTNSMDPVLDAGHNALQIVPISSQDIDVGDIISFEADGGVIIHRVVQIGEDEGGWFAITKGDNNPLSDPLKVRFSQVKRVVVAIIY